MLVRIKPKTPSLPGALEFSPRVWGIGRGVRATPWGPQGTIGPTTPAVKDGDVKRADERETKDEVTLKRGQRKRLREEKMRWEE